MARKPRLPNYDACVKLMRSSQGHQKEDGHWYLAQQADRYLDRLLADFEAEPKVGGIKYAFLDLIFGTRSPQAFDLLKRLLREDDEWADHAALLLTVWNTREARLALREVGIDPSSCQ